MNKKSSAGKKPDGKASSTRITLQEARQRVKAAKQQVKLIKAQLKLARAAVKAAKVARAQAESPEQGRVKATVKRTTRASATPNRKVAAAKSVKRRAKRVPKAVSVTSGNTAAKLPSLRPMPSRQSIAGTRTVGEGALVPERVQDGVPASAEVEAA